jgi:hypothetical protein
MGKDQKLGDSNRLIFVSEMQCVLYEAGTEYLNYI